VAKEGAAHGARANVICPGFARTPPIEMQIPEQARELGISEADVIKTVMLKETVDGEFTITQGVAEAALFLAAFPSNAQPNNQSWSAMDGSCSRRLSEADVQRCILCDLTRKRPLCAFIHVMS
jgi:NAD(P)-dependent dehydrogenase (short-subunit alcohol dehydrogenase family)